ncbi:MAG: hypothetical protein HETSPECPRED_009026 [Heterodermia speciosa]|uniref:Uncharacterized protein n=1 Tax=Heterodermia speciosa TaxID=116794 RepID=A0A8H3IVA0_9LECA|nr:MAG: hypothetical protein HETSPECPRED_009026 [Heterodermia speciosa]
MSTVALEIGSQAKGAHGTYTIAEKLHRDNVWRGANTQTNTNVIVKTAPESLLRNERNMLTRFRDVPTLRRLLNEVQDPPLLLLEFEPAGQGC